MILKYYKNITEGAGCAGYEVTSYLALDLNAPPPLSTTTYTVIYLCPLGLDKLKMPPQSSLSYFAGVSGALARPHADILVPFEVLSTTFSIRVNFVI